MLFYRILTQPIRGRGWQFSGTYGFYANIAYFKKKKSCSGDDFEIPRGVAHVASLFLFLYMLYTELKVVRKKEVLMKRITPKALVLATLRIAPLVLVVGLVTWFVVKNGSSTISILIDLSSDNPRLTLCAFMALFFLKSVSFGLPFMVLYIGVGTVYPFGWAVVVNLVGIVINMQIPYFLGRHMGGSYVQRLVARYPRLKSFEAFSKRSSLLFSFMTKFIGKIPHEITNALLGSMKIPYIPYMVGGLLGLAPTMVAITLAGNSLHEPGSPLFIFSVVATGALITISFVLYRRFAKRNS